MIKHRYLSKNTWQYLNMPSSLHKKKQCKNSLITTESCENLAINKPSDDDKLNTLLRQGTFEVAERLNKALEMYGYIESTRQLIKPGENLSTWHSGIVIWRHKDKVYSKFFIRATRDRCKFALSEDGTKIILKDLHYAPQKQVMPYLTALVNDYGLNTRALLDAIYCIRNTLAIYRREEMNIGITLNTFGEKKYVQDPKYVAIGLRYVQSVPYDVNFDSVEVFDWQKTLNNVFDKDLQERLGLIHRNVSVSTRRA